MNKLYLVNKREDITSFSAVNELRKKLNIKKAGHSGTLDKFASGLLLILTGKWTKLVEYCTVFDKSYIAKIKFGVETDTLDPEGKVIKESDFIPDLDFIKTILPKFIGTISQTPPAYSSIHVNGKRAYQLTLQGQQPVMKPRDIKIFNIEVLEKDGPFLTLYIECSKGTYIRSLARDLGYACNSCAYVVNLTRTSIGPFKLDEVLENDSNKEYHEISIEEFFSRTNFMNVATLKKDFTFDFLNGKPLSLSFFENIREGLNAIFIDDDFLGVVNYNGISFSYNFVVQSERK